MEDRLVIGYDKSEGQDHQCLIVARQLKEKTIITSCFYDEEAELIYNKLTKKGRNEQC